MSCLLLWSTDRLGAWGWTGLASSLWPQSYIWWLAGYWLGGGLPVFHPPTSSPGLIHMEFKEQQERAGTSVQSHFKFSQLLLNNWPEAAVGNFRYIWPSFCFFFKKTYYNQEITCLGTGRENVICNFATIFILNDTQNHIEIINTSFEVVSIYFIDTNIIQI